jgi:hypothetical protein
MRVAVTYAVAFFLVTVACQGGCDPRDWPTFWRRWEDDE